jgi:hypothetical protein
MTQPLKFDPAALREALANFRLGAASTAASTNADQSPALESFLHAHELAGTLSNRTISEWKWSGVDTNNISVTDPAGSIEVPVSDLLPNTPNCPRLKVALKPVSDGQIITGDKQYYAPLLVRRGGTYKQRQDIQNHKLTGFYGPPVLDKAGKPVPEVGFGERGAELTLSQIVERYPREDEGGLLLQALTGREVPVIDVVPVIPFSPDKEYDPEFSLKLNVADLPDGRFAFYVITQDRLVYRMKLRIGAQQPPIIDIGLTHDKDKKDYSWNPVSRDSIPDDLAPLIPSSNGQIKLIAVPIKTPRPQIDYTPLISASSLDRGYGGETRSMKMDFGGSRSLGSISNTVLTAGSTSTKSGDLYKDDLLFDPTRTALIYDIRPIALTPNRIQSLSDADLIGALGHIPVPSLN